MILEVSKFQDGDVVHLSDETVMRAKEEEYDQEPRERIHKLTGNVIFLCFLDVAEHLIELSVIMSSFDLMTIEELKTRVAVEESFVVVVG